MTTGDEPLSQSLVDLQLTGVARKRGKKAHFYCWCNDLQSLQPAKLRVSCSACEEGAIVLQADPCSWDDVLEPERLHGYCESCQTISTALFYFKCGADVGILFSLLISAFS